MSSATTIEVLISTMNQNDYSLLERMKIESDAIVVNQCDHDGYKEFKYNGYNVKWISMSKKGVGLSRNTALMYSTADIILWADDDMIYNEGYADEVVASFDNNPKADIVCFNLVLLDEKKNKIGGSYSKKKKKLHIWNMLRYGAPTIAARRKVIQKNRISFSLLFGGGAVFSSGEDSMFLTDSHKHKLKIYSNPYYLGEMDHSVSTWFNGYTEKYFVDKGRVYYSSFPGSYPLMFLFYSFKFSKMTQKYGITEILKYFIKGKNEMKKYR